MSENIVFFVSPSEVSQKHIGKKIRIGGLVVENSVEKKPPAGTIFVLDDGKAKVKVSYRGILPALFRESQGIIAEGFMMDLAGTFEADRLLSKHDENYRPPDNYKSSDSKAK